MKTYFCVYDSLLSTLKKSPCGILLYICKMTVIAHEYSAVPLTHAISI